ncbi:MAG: Fic family protein [Candidatus Aenigmarchaeota archaeon]|nr:Fic family protein [Candidatus Aenigmarchaeota archaeon]
MNLGKNLDKLFVKFTSYINAILKLDEKTKSNYYSDKDELIYLPLSHIELLQKSIIKMYEKSDDPIAKGYMSKSNLEFILNYVKDMYDDSKPKETKLINKAAFVFYNIALKHPFADGNKRTSIIACNAFLESNGYSIRYIPFRDSRKFIIEVAMGEKSELECQKFIKKHISKYTISKKMREIINKLNKIEP